LFNAHGRIGVGIAIKLNLQKKQECDVPIVYQQKTKIAMTKIMMWKNVELPFY